MLAYSVWQAISVGDLTIYDALHRINSLYQINSPYQPESIDLDVDLVDVVREGAEKWIAERKAFGQRKAKEVEQKGRISLGANDNP
jgi:hypothetical protein